MTMLEIRQAFKEMNQQIIYAGWKFDPVAKVEQRMYNLFWLTGKQNGTKDHSKQELIQYIEVMKADKLV